MADWDDLEAELGLWKARGLTPKLWWRDDDAQAVTPALDRLLDLSERHNLPVHLSVIPDGLSPDLAPRLGQSANTWVLQHGLAHVNHEPKGAPASEVGDKRPSNLKIADLKAGWDILRAAGLPRLLPGFVPPWNRISDETRRLLPRLGYRYLSTYDGRGDDADVPGLLHINAHLDPIRWKYDNVFRGTDKMLDMLIGHLQTRRIGNTTNPIGLVTHHLQTSDAVWDFADDLFSRTGTFWITLSELDEDTQNG